MSFLLKFLIAIVPQKGRFLKGIKITWYLNCVGPWGLGVWIGVAL